MSDLSALASLMEPSREKLYRYVLSETDPVTRDAAATAVGVSRAMAAFHLDRLVEVGLLRATYRRVSGRTGRGAGRPAKLYRRSRRRFSVTVPTRDHELLARLLAQGLTDGGPPAPTRAAAGHYGQLLGYRARVRLRAPADEPRLSRCVADVLSEIGFESVDVGRETWSRNCPFDPMSRESPTIVCQTAVAIVAGVVEGVGAAGIGVTQRTRPDWCCVVRTGAGDGGEAGIS